MTWEPLPIKALQQIIGVNGEMFLFVPECRKGQNWSLKPRRIESMALLIGALCQNWKAKLGGIGLWALLIGTQLLLCPHL